MSSTKLFATLFAFSSKLFTEVSGSTCCELRTSASDCAGETTTDCLWFESTDYESTRHTQLTGEFQQCFAIEYAACLASGASCCGPCCGGCPKTDPEDPTQPWSPPGPASIDECQLADNTDDVVEAGLPMVVAPKIDAARDDSCSTDSMDCWVFTQNANENFSPSSITFLGVDYDPTSGSCCYQYRSVYSGTPNCDGKTPEQSHLTFDIDCDVGDFEVSSASSANVGYGLDGSTCYYGIKIDSGCAADDTCDYNICLEYPNLTAGECPTTSSWVMDKASNVFSFNSLADGIPSCRLGTPSKKQLAVDGVRTRSTTMIASNQMMVGMAAMLVLIIGALAYKRYYDNKDEKYLALQDGQSYGTMNKV